MTNVADGLLTGGKMIEQEQSIEEQKEELLNVECFERLQRLQSDFINYKQRIEREREAQVKSANQELILRILPVLDDFSRAIDNVPSNIRSEDWVQGMVLIGRNLNSVLEQEGLSKIDAEGSEFDPQEHEAVFTEEGSVGEQGKVSSVIREGYRLYDKIIRPAQVSVVKGIKKEPQPSVINVHIRRGGDVRWRGPRIVPGARELCS